MARASPRSPCPIDGRRRRLARRAGVALAIAASAFARCGAAIAVDLAFTRHALFDAPYTASIADMDGDGRLELPGLINTGRGFSSRSPTALGTAATLASLTYFRNSEWPYGYLRASRDTRIVDLDNDGRPDLVNNVYWCNGDAENTTQVYLQNPDGTFRRDSLFDLLTPVRGRGETIVAADFDGDGFVDLYIPQYTRADSHPDSLTDCMAFVPNTAPAQSWLLLNNGGAGPATFHAVTGTPVTLTATDCGRDCTNAPFTLDAYAQPEGAQAVDYDEDGHVDLFVAGMLFRNAGNAVFTRVFPPRGVSPAFDEGLKFIDWNNDGYPDYVYVSPFAGVVHLYTWTGGVRDADGRIVAGQFTEVTDPSVVGAFAANAAPGTYGMSAGDIDGDGYDDVIVNGGVLDFQPKIFLNRGPPTYAFRRADVSGFAGIASLRDGPGLGDLNGDGATDVVVTSRFGNRTTFAYYNATPPIAKSRLIVEVFGRVGGRPVRNKQGSVVHVVPATIPGGFSYTRYVDGGSGYMTQGPYAISVASAFDGPHRILVRLAGGTVDCSVAPPAYVLIIDGDASPCTTLPLPPGAGIPNGHEMRALQPAIHMLLE
jgi:hypothetical protein